MLIARFMLLLATQALAVGTALVLRHELHHVADGPSHARSSDGAPAWESVCEPCAA